jgi:hypothetical protein
MIDNVDVRGAGNPMGESTPGVGGLMSPPVQTQLCDHVTLYNTSFTSPVNAAFNVKDPWLSTAVIEVQRPAEDSLIWTNVAVIDEIFVVGDRRIECKPFPSWPKWVAYDPAETPAVLGTAGTVAGQWWMSKNKFGFTILDVDTTNKLILVQPTSGVALTNTETTDARNIPVHGMMEVTFTGPFSANVKWPTVNSAPNAAVDNLFPNVSNAIIPHGETRWTPAPWPTWPAWALMDPPNGAGLSVGMEVGTKVGESYVTRPTGGANHFGFSIVMLDTVNGRALIKPKDWPVAFKLQANIAAGASGNVRRFEIGGAVLGVQFSAFNSSVDCDAKSGDVVMGALGGPSGGPFFEGGVAP